MDLNFFKELKSQTARRAIRSASVVGMSLSVLLTTALSTPALAADTGALNPKPHPLATTPPGAAHYIPDQIIVMPAKGVDKDDLAQSIKDIDGKVIDKDLMGMAYLVEVPKGTLDKELAKATKDKNFKAVQRNSISHANVAPSFGKTPNDPGYSLQFYLAQLGVQNAWVLGATGQGVVYGSLDTGVDFNYNQDLQGRTTGLLNGVGYQSYRNLPNGAEEDTSFGHGSFTTNCFGSTTNNNFGFASPCFNSTIIPVSIVGSPPNSGQDPLGASDFSIARGIQFLLLNNCKLINLSFGSDPPFTFSDPFSNPLLTELFGIVAAGGGVVFNAAGNSGIPDGIGVIHPGLVVVAAVDQTLTPATFTVFGPAIQFAAPGVGIAQTAFGGIPFLADGTSFSSPFTAAVAGQVLSVKPYLSLQQVVQIMAATCRHPQDSQGSLKLFYGNGVPNAAAAVRMAQTSF